MIDKRKFYINGKWIDPIKQNDTIYSDINIKHCNELMDLISINPSSDILEQTYNSLNCETIHNKS